MRKRLLFFFILMILVCLVMLLAFTGPKERETEVVVPAGPTLAEENDRFLFLFFDQDTFKVEKLSQLVDSGLRELVFINVKDQTLSYLSLADTFQVIFSAKISSGRGKSTPRGLFEISKKRLARASRKYGGVMTHWNCLTPDESIGIHGLKDRSYERSLGKPVSHGCIRISRKDELVFYDLAPIGTKVWID